MVILRRMAVFKRQIRHLKATYGNSRQLKATSDQLASMAEPFSLSFLHFPGVERQDRHSDITSRGVVLRTAAYSPSDRCDVGPPKAGGGL